MSKPYSNYRDLVNPKPFKSVPWKSFPPAWDTGGQQLSTGAESKMANDSTFVQGSYATVVSPLKKASAEDFPSLNPKLEEGNWDTNSTPKQNYKHGAWDESVNWGYKPQEFIAAEVEDGWTAPDVHSDASSWGSSLTEKIMIWNDSGALEAYLKSIDPMEATFNGYDDSELDLNAAMFGSYANKPGSFTREVVWSPKGNEKSKAAQLPDSAEAMLSDWKEPTPRRRRKRNNQVNPLQNPPLHPSNPATESKIKMSQPPIPNYTHRYTSYQTKPNSSHPNVPVPALASASLNNYSKSNREPNPNYYTQTHSNNANSSNYIITPAQPSTSYETRPILNSSNKDHRPSTLASRPWADTAPYAPSPEWFPKPSSGPLLRKTAYQTYAKVDVNPCVQSSQSNATSQTVDQSMALKAMAPVWKSSFMQQQNKVSNQEKQSSNHIMHSNGNCSNSNLSMGSENKNVNQNRMKSSLMWQRKEGIGSGTHK